MVALADFIFWSVGLVFFNLSYFPADERYGIEAN
jgi:hypothetical protein